MGEDGELLARRAGRVACLTLNRPRALNAISMEMFRGLHAALAAWGGDPGVDTVVIRGAGGRAFSAGGDVRAVCEAAGRGAHGDNAEMFRLEYTLDRRVYRFPKPYVALMDGLVLGGGCGLSVHAAHRVVTEHTELAMPETGIGFFPDVGASYFLSRCPGHAGTFLALTGTRIGAADAIRLGLADVFVPRRRLDDLVGALVAGTPPERALARFAGDPGTPELARHADAIGRCFAAGRVEDIVAALAAEEGDWARGVLGVLAAKAPFSLKATLRAIRAGAAMSLEDCLVMEYRLCRRFLTRPDLCEGVRAAVIDKDGAPRWNPATLDAVDAGEIEACFAPLGEDDLAFA